MSETVRIWIEDFNEGDKNVEKEIAQVKGAISNERLWEKGSASSSEARMHKENIELLKEYLDWLENVAR